MSVDTRKLEWQVVAAASGALAAVATRKLLTAAWHAAGWDSDESERRSWGQALTWGVALGAGMGAARVGAQRAAALGFERVTGDPPPVEAAP